MLHIPRPNHILCPNVCMMCFKMNESHGHIFLHCEVALKLLTQVLTILDNILSLSSTSQTTFWTKTTGPQKVKLKLLVVCDLSSYIELNNYIVFWRGAEVSQSPPFKSLMSLLRPHIIQSQITIQMPTRFKIVPVGVTKLSRALILFVMPRAQVPLA